MPNEPPPLTPGFRSLIRLGRFVELENDASLALESAMGEVTYIADSHECDLSKCGSPQACFIECGFACQIYVLSDGRRQITELLLPGDVIRMSGHAGEYIFKALGPVTCYWMTSDVLERIAGKHHRIGRALFYSALIREAILRQRLVSLCKRNSEERLAHLLCETFMRCLLVNLADGASFPFPISANDVANVLDISPNEVSGSMAALATSLLIASGDKTITILDFAKLQAVGHFDPGYLSRLSP